MTRGRSEALRAGLAKAWDAREPLRRLAHTTCFRVANGEADGLAGLTVDLFSDVAVVSAYAEWTADEELAIVEAVARVCPVRSVYLKRRPREARVVATTQKDKLAPEPPAWGEPRPELEALEGGLRFKILPAQGLSVGLYLDMREPRAWLRGQVQGKSVLNCFAYTCAFGVVARSAGAARAVNVDLSRRVLDWGEDNARLNGQSVERRDYVSGDVFEWLARFEKKGERFDVVVLDPPSFAKGKAGTFSAGTDYAALAELGAARVAPGGLLLACCNLARLTPARFESMVRTGLQRTGRAPSAVSRLGPSTVDFPPPPGEPAPLKVLAVRL